MTRSAWKAPAAPWDLFCSGHIELPDGSILVAWQRRAVQRRPRRGRYWHAYAVQLTQAAFTDRLPHGEGLQFLGFQNLAGV